MHKTRIFLIDATAFCYRAFYAIKSLTTSSGQPTNAIYGFMRMLNKIIKEENPDYLGVCFDVSRETFRQAKYAEYKSQRPAMPDGLSSQIPIIKQILFAHKIPIFEKEGFEADDIIATIVNKARENGFSVTIISSDKDLLQLVDDSVEVFNPHSDKQPKYNVEAVENKFGIQPRQIPDLIAFIGDATDNIPAIKGISEKKAVELLRKYNTLEEIYENIDNIPGDLKAVIQGNCGQIKLNKELASLDGNVKFDLNLEHMRLCQPDYQRLFELYKELEFKAFLKELPVADSEERIDLEEIEDKDIRKVLTEAGEVFIYLEGNKLFLGSHKKIFSIDTIGQSSKEFLADQKVKKIGHDLKSIKVALAKESIPFKGLFFDTMIAAYLLNPSNSSFSFQDLAWDFLKKAVNPDNLEGRAVVSYLMQLKPALEKELHDKALTNLFDKIEMPLVNVLSEMEIEGIKIDVQKLNMLSSQLQMRLAQLIQEIYSICGCEFNINSPKQLREVLFEKLKLPVIKKTKTGASTDEEVLRALAQDHKLPQLLLEYRQLSKLKSTYVDALPQLVDEKTARIHTSFNQTGTETGRLSSSNPNLQNLPIRTELGRSIREAVVVFDQKSEIVSCDYSQIELRVLAHLSKDEVLIDAFKQGMDIHKKTAALIYGIAEDAVTEQMRDVAKRVNFGIVYGLSAYGLSRDLKIPPQEAQNFIDAYFLRYPRVREYIDEQISLAKKEGFVTTILGRRRYLPEINDKNQAIQQFACRQAMNTPIQGSASDLIKLAMVEIFEEIQEKKFQSKMILQIHDELLFNVILNEAKAFKAMVKEKMENVLELSVPIKVDIKAGANWGVMS